MEKTRVRYNAGDIFYFIFSVLHKKTPSVKTPKEFDKLEFTALLEILKTTFSQ